MKNKSTITDLPEEIEALIPEHERTILINQIITEACAGEFHNFKNNKYPAPKLALYKMLVATSDERLKKIAAAVANDYYDESPDEEDKTEMVKDMVANSSSLRSAFSMIKTIAGSECPKCQTANFAIIAEADGSGCATHKNECPYFKHG